MAVTAAPELWCSILGAELASAAAPPLPSPLVLGKPGAQPHPWQQCLCTSQVGVGKMAPQHHSRPGLPSPPENGLWIEGEKLDFMKLTGADGGAGAGAGLSPEGLQDRTTHFSKEMEGQGWG